MVVHVVGGNDDAGASFLNFPAYGWVQLRYPDFAGFHFVATRQVCYRLRSRLLARRARRRRLPRGAQQLWPRLRAGYDEFDGFQ